jgi:hypothetical protein
MVSDVLRTRPNSPAEELRFESAEHAERMFERSKLVSKIVVAVALALVLIRLALPTFFVPLGESLSSLTSIVGIAVFAVFLALASYWSSRVHRDESCDRYARYIRSKR